VLTGIGNGGVYKCPLKTKIDNNVMLYYVKIWYHPTVPAMGSGVAKRGEHGPNFIWGITAEKTCIPCWIWF